MGTSSFRMQQLLDPASGNRSVVPVHHGGHADFSIYIQYVLVHSKSDISAHFCGIAANYHTGPIAGFSKWLDCAIHWHGSSQSFHD